jgi:hypothetical protein
MRRLPLLAIVLGITIAETSHAFLVQIAWTGTIDIVGDPDGITPGFIETGTPVTGVFAFDSTTPGFGSGATRSYVTASPGFRIDFPNGAAPAPQIFIDVENDGAFGWDRVEVTTSLQPLVGFLQADDGSFLRIDLAQILFSDPTGTSLENGDLPTSDAQWALLAGGRFQVSGCPFGGGDYCEPPSVPVFIAFGTIESVSVLVPEPATALLLVIGFALLRTFSERR